MNIEKCWCPNCGLLTIKGLSYPQCPICGAAVEKGESMPESYTLLEAAKNYIEKREAVVVCRQDHFKQLCQRCEEWHDGRCQLYSSYVGSWMALQLAVKREEKKSA